MSLKHRHNKTAADVDTGPNVYEQTSSSHHQHYSGTNRIPSIRQFLANLDREKQIRDAQIDEQQRARAAAARQAAAGGLTTAAIAPGGGGALAAAGGGVLASVLPAGLPISLPTNMQVGLPPLSDTDSEIIEHTTNLAARAGKNRRTVRDPVTGRDVEIDDMSSALLHQVKNPVLSVPNANLDKPTTAKTEPTMSGEEYRRMQDITAPPDPIEPGSTSDVPIHGEKTNVLFHPTPAVSYEPMYANIEARANFLCASVFFSIVFGGMLFGARLWGLLPLAFAVASGVFMWAKELIRQGRDTEWLSEQRRGEMAVVNLIPESVEWLNSALAVVWGLINPDMFAAVADTLEDIMQASVPAVVENVKVNDISQGSNPLRILSLRALPDSHVQDLKDEIRKQDEELRRKDPEEIAADEAGGAFYNLEATVAYHSLPSTDDVASKASRNMGMQLVFYLGVKGLFGVPFPVWVELNGLVCTVRLRVSLSPNAPFVKTVSATLMGIPKVQASCIPLLEKGANILNLPLISNFVNWAIAAMAGLYVAPKSLTLDVGKMLQGDDIQKETAALGVLFIRIHKATGLSKQDSHGSRGGGSDPYICVAFSKFGKPQYCTRVIQDDLNPIFSETAALLVTADIIRADEQLSLELWDSDRSSADDVVGKVELSIQELIQQPGRMFPQVSNLSGMKADTTMPGELHWEVGFFGKTQFRKALRTDGKDPFIPKALQDKKELQETHGVLATAEEDAVICTPPDPLWPSGILSVVVHQIVGLELENLKGSDARGRRGGKREFEPARPEAGELKEEQGKKLPSSYCTIVINDELMYKTRTKVVSSRPIFEAGTERFIRDWRSAIVTVTVRDSRNRQHDPIIGVVPLKLSDIFVNASQSTRWYPLDGGIGFGRIRISILFRSVELKLPPAQVGFGEVGTFEFMSDTITTSNWAPSSRVKVYLRTGGSSALIKRERCSRVDGANGLSWDITGHHHGHYRYEEATGATDEEAPPKQRVRLPVQYRYRSPVFFEFHVSGRRSKDAFASVWLQDLVDGEVKDFNIPIWKCDNPMRLSQNYITETNYMTVPDIEIQEVGRLRFRGRFKPGTDRDHLKFVSDNDSRETIETWEACYAEGVRSEEVKAEVPPLVQKLHNESLQQGRDVLAKAPEDDKQMWLARDGTDWSGTFGKDPAEMMVASGEAPDVATAKATIQHQQQHRRRRLRSNTVQTTATTATTGTESVSVAGTGAGTGASAGPGGDYNEFYDDDDDDDDDDEYESSTGQQSRVGSRLSRGSAVTGGDQTIHTIDMANRDSSTSTNVVPLSPITPITPTSPTSLGSPNHPASPTSPMRKTHSYVSGVHTANGSGSGDHLRPPNLPINGNPLVAHAVDMSRRRPSSSSAISAVSRNSSLVPKSSSSSRGPSALNPVRQLKDYKERSRDLHRKHRGLMQWTPMRNLQFAKDQAKFTVRRALNVGKLDGRTPDVETEA